MIKIDIRSNVLTDGSVVYDIGIGQAIIPAISRQDADELAAQLKMAIDQFSTDDAEINDTTAWSADQTLG